MSLPILIPHDNPADILQSIVETAIDGIFLINTSGTILMVNTAGTGLFQYSTEELLGQNITLLMPSPHRENHHHYVHNYLETGIKKIIGIGREIEGLRKDGTRFPARLAVSEIIRGETHFFTGIIQDLTAMKEVEREIRQLNHELELLVVARTTELQDTVNLLLVTNQQLNQSIEKHKIYEMALVTTRDELRISLEKEKELSTLKSRFISMASHEFKTPLSSILSSAALISRYQEEGQSTDRQRHVDRIKSSVNHLNNVLTDFLSIARLEEGALEPSVNRFSLGALIADLNSEAEGLLKSGQQLICNHDFDEQEMISDKNIVRNILYNLISNAIK
jgi:PAS domain S-box-containing protein